MNYDDLKARIKEHEGFRDQVYKDSLGFATIGYGHLVLDTDHFIEGQSYPKEHIEKVYGVKVHLIHDQDGNIMISPDTMCAQ